MNRSGDVRVGVGLGTLAAIALVGTAPFGAAQAQAADVTRVLNWDGGDRVAVSVPGEVRYVPGAANKVTITGPREVVDRIYVRDGVIGYEPGAWLGWRFGRSWRKDEVHVVLTTPHLSDARISGAARLDLGRLEQDRLGLGLSGAGRVRASGAIRTLNLSVSGAGGVALEGLKTGRIEADMSGAGWIKASGESDSLALRMSGAGNADFGGLDLQDADARLSGVGAATLAPKRSAEVAISGAAHVRLLTDPPRLRTHRSGAGGIATPHGWEG